MKKTLFCLLLATIAISTIIGTTGCSNKYKDMLPGEVRLEENDYRNDDEICDITYTTSTGKDTTMSAIEIRAIWHAVIINAEKNFEKLNDELKNTYESPVAAENAFYGQIENSLLLMSNKYPDSYISIINELHRAEAHVYINYVWCAVGEDYVNLKFEITPPIVETTAIAEEK